MKIVFGWIGRFALVAIGTVLLLQFYYFACVGWYSRFDPSATAFMRSHMDVVKQKNPDAKPEQQWVPYARISDHTVSNELVSAISGN